MKNGKYNRYVKYKKKYLNDILIIDILVMYTKSLIILLGVQLGSDEVNGGW